MGTILTPDVIHYQMCSSQQSPQLVLGSFTALASRHQPARAGILPVQTSANISRISCLALRCLWEREPGGFVLQSINTSLPCVIYKSQCDIAISLPKYLLFVYKHSFLCPFLPHSQQKEFNSSLPE